MFDLAWSEILLVGVVALLVVGPKELPDLLRSVGRWVRKARSMASSFQSTFDQMMRDEEMDKHKSEMDKAFSGTPALPQIERPRIMPDPPTEPQPEPGDTAAAAEDGVAESKPAQPDNGSKPTTGAGA